MSVRVCITDDHSIVRAGIRQILEREPDIRVVGEAASARDLTDRCIRGELDLLILDLTLPDMNGFELLARVRRERPELPVLVLSMHIGEQYALRAFEEGAMGYVSKETAVEDLVPAVRAVLSGRRYASPALAGALKTDSSGRSAVVKRLSQRERQVLLLLASGNAVGEIAKQLELDKRTVSTYKSRLLEKLSLRSTADLVRFALEQGLIT